MCCDTAWCVSFTSGRCLWCRLEYFVVSRVRSRTQNGPLERNRAAFGGHMALALAPSSKDILRLDRLNCLSGEREGVRFCLFVGSFPPCDSLKLPLQLLEASFLQTGHYKNLILSSTMLSRPLIELEREDMLELTLLGRQNLCRQVYRVPRSQQIISFKNIRTNKPRTSPNPNPPEPGMWA